MQALEKYLGILADEAQADMVVFHTGWVVWTVLPLFVYILYAMLKWYILLMPVTLPLSLWLGRRTDGAALVKAAWFRNS